MTWLLGNLQAISLLLIGLLAAVAEIFRRRAKHHKAESEQAKAALKRKDDIEAGDSEIEGEFSDHRERSKEDRKHGKVPDHLSDPDNF